MPITIGTNIASLRTVRQLGRTTDELASSFRRLASGVRINSASDDAAGLSIADGLNARVRVNSQAIRNLSDGLSAVSIAKGALTELANLATRQMELANQAANGTYSSTQRLALHREAKALTQEYNRIVQTTEFNGQNLLDSTFRGVGLQAGSGDDAVIMADIGGGLARGAGTGAYVQSLTFTSSTDVDSADLDGDGNADFVVTNTSGQARIFLGNGDGTFEAPALTPSAGLNLMQITLGDLNGDGRADIVAGTLQNRLMISLNQGDGTFAAWTSLPPGLAIDGNTPPVVVDIDGDGNVDVATSGTGGAALLFGNGDGSFTAPLILSAGITSNHLDVGDLNGDGRNDLIVTDVNFNQGAYTFLNSGGRSFIPGTHIGEGANRYVSLLADLNDDDKLDRVTILDQTSGGASYVRLGSGNGQFGPILAAQLTNEGGSPYYRELAASDLNGDGMIDLLATSSTGAVWLSAGRGDGTFDAAVSIGAGGLTSYGLSLADFNNDGATDIVTAAGVLIAVPQFVSTIESLDLKSAESSLAALETARSTLDRITSETSRLGALESRLNVAMSNLQTSVVEESAARNRIMDVDIAQEASALARTQILQQAGAAVLAQANLQPLLAARLLEN